MEFEDFENVEYLEESIDSGGVYEDSGEASDLQSVSEYDVVADDVDSTGVLDEETSIQLLNTLNELSETLTLTSSYGSMSDYYNQSLGFTVFPDYDTYQYFIDIDADGSLWTEASDGHYVAVANLETYEESIAPVEEEEEEILPTETELQTLETLESIQGTLVSIKANDVAYHETMLAYEEKQTQYQEVTCYTLLATCFFVAFSCGNHYANTFFNRMRL